MEETQQYLMRHTSRRHQRQEVKKEKKKKQRQELNKTAKQTTL